MPRHLRRPALAALIAAAALAAPSSAAAGTIVNAAGVVTVTADAGQNDNIYVSSEGFADAVRIRTRNSNYDAGLTGCSASTIDFYKQYVCDINVPITKVVVHAGDGNDALGIFSGNLGFTLELRGGDGGDSLYGGELGDSMFGEGGNDYLDGRLGGDTLEGGDGADTLNGDEGVDTLRGGGDRDSLNGGPAGDTIDGGAGFDSVNYNEKGTTPLTITLDGTADDGAAGEGDNVQTNVEDAIGAQGNDTIIGSSVANELDGGGGNDIMDGGAGTDRYQGGLGIDNIISRDGNPERIECGDGAGETDVVRSDTVDEVSGCENNEASSDLESDRDKDGFVKPQDCNDTDGSINPGAADKPDDGIDQNCDNVDAQVLDADGDGFPKGVDCDDKNPNAKPGGTEIVGNDVDENCDLFAPPTPVVETPVNLFFFHSGGITFVTGAGVGEMEAGTTVVIRCKGKKRAGCPKKKSIKKTVTKKTTSFSFFKQYRKARLRKGATIEIVITKPGAVGRFVIFKMKPRAVPTPKPMCVNPGETKATQC
jgi:hypothetical protein